MPDDLKSYRIVHMPGIDVGLTYRDVVANAGRAPLKWATEMIMGNNPIDAAIRYSPKTRSYPATELFLGNGIWLVVMSSAVFLVIEEL